MRELIALIFGLIVCIQLSNGEENIPICKTGLHWDVKLNKCVPPVCNPPCDQFANCTIHGCVCHTGYEMVHKKCAAKCSKSCGPHGVCISPEKCGCNTGYHLNKKTQQCEAHCDPPCKANAFCSEPDICACKRGYLAKDGVCEPVCSKGCPDKSFCVAPNKCYCPLGFEWDQSHKKCLPKCTPKCGLNSYCHKTHECKCRLGYKPNDLKSLSCSLPYPWWVYLVVAVLALTLVGSISVIIYCCIARSRNINYYPNSSFSDTTQIIR
ncbi:epidermal growth factor-like protein [Drosophila nasuta]|uniref:epidermal growth factor-like protein n=1 Tax=Drosophila nasuta TaxID=42062 RepID=UPI00295E97AE|nr:epidermal growth factor-like protein [Drosophila nasuta]